MADTTTRPIRVNVDLSPDAHRKMRGLCDRLAVDLDIPRVTAADLFRALLAEALSSEDLRTRIVKTIVKGDSA